VREKEWDEPTRGPASELRDLIAQLTAAGDGVHPTSIRSLCLMRFSSSGTSRCGVLSPSFGLAAQGQKELQLGGEVYGYSPGQHIVSSADLPLSGRILGATPGTPYLGLRLRFDLGSLRSLIEEAQLPTPLAGERVPALHVSRTGASLLDAVLRLVRVLQSPAEIPVLAPMIEREILFRLLLGEAGALLHRLAQESWQPERIGIALTWLKRHFRERFRVDDLARRTGMSVSSFHHWFRGITGMSPLQYQKQLRLQEARSILRNEHRDVGSVSRCVGYESSSQFSREYSRMFGNPPVREIGVRNSRKARLGDSG